jgi:hypothetical protein
VQDIDKPEYRHRLWSVSDSPLVHYIRDFHGARINREITAERWSRTPEG